MNQPSFSPCTDCKIHISTHYCELANNRNVFVGFGSENFPLQRQSVQSVCDRFQTGMRRKRNQCLKEQFTQKIKLKL